MPKDIPESPRVSVEADATTSEQLCESFEGFQIDIPSRSIRRISYKSLDFSFDDPTTDVPPEKLTEWEERQFVGAVKEDLQIIFACMKWFAIANPPV